MIGSKPGPGGFGIGGDVGGAVFPGGNAILFAQAKL
jgi:hypothetical protein